MVLAGAMALASGALWWAAIRPEAAAPLVSGVNPFVVGALVALGELCTVDVYLRRETHTVSLRSIALVFGLFVLSPPVLLAVYVVGAVAVIAARLTRLFGVKLVFNVGLFMTEAAVAIAVFLLIAGFCTWYDPRKTWLAAMTAARRYRRPRRRPGLPPRISLRQGHLEADGTAGSRSPGRSRPRRTPARPLVAVILYSASPASVTLLARTRRSDVRCLSRVVLWQRHSELEVLREYTTVWGPPRSSTSHSRPSARPATDSRPNGPRSGSCPRTANATACASFDDDAHTLDPHFRIPITDALWGPAW